MNRKVGPRKSISLLDVIFIESKPTPGDSVSENENTKSKIYYVGKKSKLARLCRFDIIK
jgi:hypothetical protein